MRFWRGIFTYVGIITVLLYSFGSVSFASSSPWSQSDWSGGSGQSAFSNSTQYSTGGNVKTSSANQVTLTNQNVGNLGTGNDGAITVSADKNINADSMIAGRSCSDGGDAVNYSVTSSVSSGASSITLSSTPANGCLAAGDEILIINLEGTNSDNSTVGKYETAIIQSIAGATLTLGSTLSNSYDGTTQKIMVQRVPNYTNVTVNSGKTLTASAWNGTKGGVLFFRATGTVTVTGSISVNALGYRGGTNNANGESYDGFVGTGGAVGAAGTDGGGSGSGSTSLPAAGTRGGGGAGGATDSGDQGSGGGGGGGYGGGGGGAGGGNDCSGTAGNGGTGGGTDVVAGGGGGGGGYAGCGSAGVGGSAGSAGTNATHTGLGGAAATSNSATGQGGSGGNGDGPGGLGGVGGGGGGGGGLYGSSDLSMLFFGSGGGGGNNSANNGQNGGGIISVTANTLTNNGSMTSNGANATTTSAGQGAGGAGAGGSILLSANTLTLGSNTVTASGGSSSNASSDGGGGGGGGVGRIAAYSGSSVSGTSSPSYATTSPSYQTSGTLTSSIFDTGLTNINWGVLTYNATTPANTTATVKVRTGNQADMSDATAFSSCTAATSGSSIANNSCVNAASEYVQYQVTLSTSDTSSTPTFTSFSLAFTQTPSASNSNSGSGSTCNTVGLAPNLYEIDPLVSSVILYFTPVSSADTYTISYGMNSSANQYSTSFKDSDHSGAVSYTINSLDTNTAYYFKVEGNNGCSASSWSNTKSSTTSSAVPTIATAFNQITDAFAPTKKLDIVSSKLTANPTPTLSATNNAALSSGLTLDVKVLGANNIPLAGVNVTLHSKVQTAKTDKNGIAHFSNVEKGEHHVVLAYNGYTGQQSLTVDGKNKDNTLTMQVQLTNGMPWGIFAGIVGGFIIIVGVLLFIIFKKHKKQNS